MRVAIVGHHVAPIRAPFVGGVESMTWGFARWLARRGHEVILYAPPGSEVPGVTVRELQLRETFSELARADVSMPPERFMSAHAAYQRAMLELAARDDIDLVHSHSLHYLPIVMSELLSVPLLATLHCPPTPWLESALRACRARRPHLVAVSHATARMWSAATEVVTVIPNGVDAASWSPGPGGPDLAWSGRIVPEKAPHLAVAAARRAGRRLRIAGPIVDRQYFRERVAPLLGDDVVYVGHLTHDGLLEFYAHSAALLQTPVWEEPFGLTAVEAMATGTPVVSFARGGIPEVIGEAAGMLVAPGDVGGLAAAVLAAAQLDRAAVREHAVTWLGIDRMGLAYTDLYAALIAEGGPAIDDGDALGAAA
jgi:glycosyltransferase involved in cell wall biosynthesis